MPYHRTYGSVWGAAQPAYGGDDLSTVILAMRVRALQDGWIVGARHAADMGVNGNRVAFLYDSSGTGKLRAATFPYVEPSGSGISPWQHTYFHKRYRLLEGEHIIIAVWMQQGGYYAEQDVLNGAPMVGDGVEFPADGDVGSNGLYSYDNDQTLYNSYLSSVYSVDVLFQKDVE